MELKKNQIKQLIEDIRTDIGHAAVEVNIKEIIWNPEEKTLIIITPDRPDKSAVIGKGGWVVGRLKETLGIKNIHVAAYIDLMVKKYRMELSLTKLNHLLNQSKFPDPLPVKNMQALLLEKIENPYHFNFLKYFKGDDDNKQIKTNFSQQEKLEKEDPPAMVALSGGVDSSFSLIIAHFLGFNPLPVTIDPGTLILPSYYKKNIDTLTYNLSLDHRYLKADFTDLIEKSLSGRFHPCGRCSKLIHQKLFDFARKKEIPVLIFGDLLSTGYQSILIQEGLVRINLPALLAVSKMEIKKLSYSFGVKPVSKLGCPLLGEVEKKFPHMSRYSIQRVLRETRAGLLEPGEGLDLIWSSFKHFK